MRILLAALLVLAPLAPLHADPAPALEEDERRLASLRPVAVTVWQDGFGFSVDIGRVAADYGGGGLLGALIIAGQDNKDEILEANAANRAHSTIAPLREALMDFDVETLALDTTERALGATDWFAPSVIAVIPEQGGITHGDFFAEHPSEQVGLVDYIYQLSPDFTQVQVIAEISVQAPDDEKPQFAQQIVSVVRLNKRSYEEHRNVARWAANDGALARDALVAAFARLETAIPAVLALTPDQFDDATDKKRESQFAAGFHGPLLMRDETGPVIWSKGTGFIAVQSAGD